MQLVETKLLHLVLIFKWIMHYIYIFGRNELEWIGVIPQSCLTVVSSEQDGPRFLGSQFSVRRARSL